MSKTEHIKSTFKHAIIYSGSSLLNKLVGFIMLPVYAYCLRGEGYGIIGMIDVVLSVLTIFIGNGMFLGLSRFYYIRKTEEEKNTLISTSIFSVSLMVAAVCIPSILLNKQIAYLAFGKDGLEFYITLAILTFIADLIANNALIYILVKKKSIFFSVLSLFKLVAGLSLNILLIVHLKMGVLGYLYSGLITAILFSSVLLIYTFHCVGFHFNKDDAKDLLSFLAPLIPGYIAMFIRLNATRILLRTYLSLSLLGTYSMLSKFTTLIGVLISGPFGKSWGVIRLEICEKEEGPSTMARVFTLQMALTFFIGLILALEIPLILRILTPEEFWLSGSIVLIGVMSRILMSSFEHMQFGLVYAKKTYKISIIQGVSAVITLISNIVLIKMYGLFGAIIASFIVALLMNIHAYYISKKHYYIPFEWNKLTTILVMTGVLFYGIDPITISKSGAGIWLDSNVSPAVKYLMELVHLENIKDGKLLSYMVGNIPVLVDGCIKLCFSFLFLPGLIVFGVIPKERAFQLIRLKNLRHPLKMMSN